MANRNPWRVDDIRWAEWEYVHNPAYRRQLEAATGDVEKRGSAQVQPRISARAVIAYVLRYRWPLAIGFVAGCYFTTGAAWVWSWFL